MGKWIYRISFLLCLVLVAGLIAGFFIFLTPKPGENWLIYPNEEGLVLSGTVTIQWNPDKVETDKVKIWWTNRTKCDPNMLSEQCWQIWQIARVEGELKLIAEVSNTDGEYQWDTTQYPNGDYNHIHITDTSEDHRDTSNHPFAIQN